MQPETRPPAVAGMFYPGTAAGLERQLASLIVPDPEPHPCAGCVAPHAGYVYSGPVAGRLYGHVDLPRRVVVLGPNHTGQGAPVSVAPEAAWATPMGEVPVDAELRERLLAALPGATAEPWAHRREHSIEVQLPFLLARRPDLAVVPICLAHLGLEECLALGEALGRELAALDEPAAVVASSDMTHYEPDPVARQRDRLAIEAALTGDPGELYDTVHRHRISMCGVIPATVMLAAARRLGGTAPHLVDYMTSGDTSGDRSAVVGYAGICVPRGT